MRRLEAGAGDRTDAPPASCDAAVGTTHGATLAMGDGIEDRFYWLHVPASYQCAPMPLLVDFHGTAQGTFPEEAYQTDALIAFSEANHVIVARPRSRSSTFQGSVLYQWDINAGDLPRNVTFANNLVAELSRVYTIDPSRVYASGFSSGANMVAQFLAASQPVFHGVAAIAGGDWSHVTMRDLSQGMRVYMATGYRDYLWPSARAQIAAMTTARLPGDQLAVRHTGGGHDLYAWHFDELWRFLDGGTPPGGGEVAAPWTAVTLPSGADVNVFAVDTTDTLVAAGAHGRTWRLGPDGWALDLDRGGADYTALCFGPSGRAVVGGQSVAVVGSAAGWGTSSTVPDFGGQLGIGWVNSVSCRGDGSVVAVGYWSAAVTSDGTTWTRFHVPSQFDGFEAQVAGVATAPSGATVAAGYYDFLGRAPAGASATTAILHATQAEWWNAITAVAGGKFWAVGDGGAILVSGDDGQSWTAQVSGTTENLYAVHFADAMHGAAVGRRGTVLVTADGGAHWISRPLGADLYLGAVHVDATTIWIGGEGGLVASSPRP